MARRLPLVLLATALLAHSCVARQPLDPIALYGSIDQARACLAAAWQSATSRSTTPVQSNCLRYSFHDCGTYDSSTDDGGCNGSLLNEMDFNPSSGLDLCNDVVGQVLADVRSVPGCAGTSAADIIQVLGSVGTFMSGGPACPVIMGRQDRPMSDNNGIDRGVSGLPDACDTVTMLLARFTRNGFNDPLASLVVLSGAHNIGRSRATSDDADSCSRGVGGMTLANTQFDGHYYKELTRPFPPGTKVKGPGWFTSDNSLINGGNQDTANMVIQFATNATAFLSVWCDHFVEMGLLGVSVDPDLAATIPTWLPPGVSSDIPESAPTASPPAMPVASPPAMPVASPPAMPVASPPAMPVASPPPTPVASPPPAPVASPPPAPVASPPPAPIASPPPPVVKTTTPRVGTPNPQIIATYKTLGEAVAANAANWPVLVKLAALVGGNTLTAYLTNPSLAVTVLVPGNGPVAQAMLTYLDGLSKSNRAAAQSLATAIVSYHILPKAYKWKSSGFSKAKDFPSLLASQTKLAKTTVTDVSIKSLSGTTLLASGIANGVGLNVTATLAFAKSRGYLLDDLLLPPSSSLPYPDAIKGSAGVPMPLDIVSGLTAISKTVTTAWAGEKNAGSVFLKAASSVDAPLVSMLKARSAAYTVFLPTNTALKTFLTQKKLSVDTVPYYLLRHHVITTRAWRLASFNTNNVTVTYKTVTGSKPLLIAGLVETNAAGQSVTNFYEICPGKGKKPAQRRQIKIRRSDVIAGKSVMHYVDQVLDLCA